MAETLKSQDVMKQLDYLYTMHEVNQMLEIKAVTGSQKVGNKYATFYKDKIDEMLKNEYINCDILRELQSRANKDLREVRSDRRERAGMSDFTDKQTEKNDVMMSMIMDFIMSLPEPKEIVVNI